MQNCFQNWDIFWVYSIESFSSEYNKEYFCQKYSGIITVYICVMNDFLKTDFSPQKQGIVH